MSDGLDPHYQELRKTIGELQKELLLDILHRLERLELTGETYIFARLPSLETATDRESAMRQIASRSEVLESQVKDER